MPRVNRRPKKKTSGYSTHHVFQLRHGHDFGLGFNGDHEAIAAAWEIFRDEILKDWLREPCLSSHGGPGTRPWGWWEFDANELRRCITGVHPFDNPEREACIVRFEQGEFPNCRQGTKKTYFGMPSCLIYPGDFAAAYETEVAYLKRLNLLLPGELELLSHE